MFAPIAKLITVKFVLEYHRLRGSRNTVRVLRGDLCPHASEKFEGVHQRPSANRAIEDTPKICVDSDWKRVGLEGAAHAAEKLDYVGER